MRILKRITFGPSVLRESIRPAVFISRGSARFHAPTMTSADFSSMPTRGLEDLPRRCPELAEG
jgi:hypothetical protein